MTPAVMMLISHLAYHGAILTFDDGPRPETTPIILKTLKKNHIHAVFCIMTYNLYDKRRLTIAKREIAQGHMICNHSHTHPLFSRISPKRQRWEILKAESMIWHRLHYRAKLFRAPGCLRTKTMWSTLRWYGLHLLRCGVDSEDWRSRTTKAQELRNILRGWKRNRKRGKLSIILMHGTSRKTAALLQTIIDSIRIEDAKLHKVVH